jgi:hypothetical protein
LLFSALGAPFFAGIGQAPALDLPSELKWTGSRGKLHEGDHDFHGSSAASSEFRGRGNVMEACPAAGGAEAAKSTSAARAQADAPDLNGDSHPNIVVANYMYAELRCIRAACFTACCCPLDRRIGSIRCKYSAKVSQSQPRKEREEQVVRFGRGWCGATRAANHRII